MALLLAGLGCLDTCTCPGEAGSDTPLTYNCVELSPGECADADPAIPQFTLNAPTSVVVRSVYPKPLPTVARFGTVTEQGEASCYIPGDETFLPQYGAIDLQLCQFYFFSDEDRESYVRELQYGRPAGQFYFVTRHRGVAANKRPFASQVHRLVALDESVLRPDGSRVTLTLIRSSSVAISTALWPYPMVIRAQLPNGTGQQDLAPRLIDGPASFRYPRGTRVEISHQQVYQLNWNGPCERLQNPAAFCVVELNEWVTTVEVDN